ncbi:MAG TPA: response regulator [Vicinamibacterales bacterium]|nr:response regulator [Vicinamibacterales bacterium]
MPSNPRRLVLIVEDDPGVAILQRRRLERAHFRVQVVSDVNAAIAVLEQQRVDLVLIDYRLGTTTGLDLHRRMKASGFDVPVIIVSGSMDDAMVIEAIRTGVRDVVVKNADYLDYLSDAVRSVLEQAATVPEPKPQEARRTRVLVAEDDLGVATLEARQLQRAGYDVEIATTADEALAAVRRDTPNLVILDLRLTAESSGLDLYDTIKAEGWNVPAILVTGYADQAVAIKALRAGVRDFLPKSADYLEYLPTAVDRVVAQVRVERKLAESEVRLASIIGTTMDAIVMCDSELRIKLFNRSAEEMFGCAAAVALDQPIARFVPGRLLPEGGSGRGPSGSSSAHQRLEVDGLRYDGTEAPIEVSISEVVVHGNRMFTVIARDISERRRNEMEMREAERRKDEFLGMLAHELRNPLAAVMTAGEVLHRTVPDAQALKLTGVVRRQTRALARMVDDLLDVSRVTMGKIQLATEPLLLSEMVSRAADASRDAMRQQQLQFDVHVDDDPVWLKGDSTRLEQVLSNLLNNAMKFTPPGGRVTLEARGQEHEAILRVADTGVGIPPAVLPRVFDLFVQADTSLDRAKSGLGIGLALVQKLVMLHGGSITAASAGPGHGSEFVVRLPVSNDQAATTSDDAAASQTPDTPARLRVLVVDDQRDVADAVAMLIESIGHDVGAVYDGATALAVSLGRPPHVMFVDLGMPGMTGYELARQIRREPALSKIHLVALTGYGRDEDRAQAAAAGFDAHITKPLVESRLREVMANLAMGV